MILHTSEYKSSEICENLAYEEKPIRILNRKDQVPWNKTIPLVKVLKKSHTMEEAI